MSEHQIHYVMLPTVNADGKDTGVLQIPVLVRGGLPADAQGALQAGIDPDRMFWFSRVVQLAAVKEKYPLFATLLGDPE